MQLEHINSRAFLAWIVYERIDHGKKGVVSSFDQSWAKDGR